MFASARAVAFDAHVRPSVTACAYFYSCDRDNSDIRLGCKILVVHPGSFLTAEENKVHLYDKLLPYAKEMGVIITTGNMFKWKDETETETVPSACGTAQDFIEHIDLINDSNFTACLDIGHAEMVNCEGAA